MKKIAILMALCLAFTALVGCGAAAPASSAAAPALPETLEEIMDASLTGLSEDEMPMLMPAEMNENGAKYAALNADTSEYCVGVPIDQYAEGIAAEAAISAVPFSVCVVRANSAEEAADLAAAIEENADPAKWICVQAEKKAVSYIDDVVLLAMADPATVDKIVANFEALAA